MEKDFLQLWQWNALSTEWAKSSVFSLVNMEWWKRGGETGGEEGREGECQEEGREKGGREESWSILSK